VRSTKLECRPQEKKTRHEGDNCEWEEEGQAELLLEKGVHFFRETSLSGAVESHEVRTGRGKPRVKEAFGAKKREPMLHSRGKRNAMSSLRKKQLKPKKGELTSGEKLTNHPLNQYSLGKQRK